uniref:L-aminoadipate-semialdehyde dehydrogenase-phosphopantetheinyl transferase n=1 Tax=Trichobilharzia regenti TaxID=157069 RepID=A0AA85KDS5_TRIRE|nr:unnamed protein product [Trichobilharzia regenti]
MPFVPLSSIFHHQPIARTSPQGSKTTVESEQHTALRYAYQRDVLSSMVGKLLIRGTAVRHFGIPPCDVKLERSSEGRPYLIDHYDKLDFNISHGGDFTIIAATSEGRCGTDVMRIELPPSQTSVRDFALKMKSVFSTIELDRILSPDCETERIKRFYEHWCLKEAYVKALGCGIRIPLHTVECHFPEDGYLFAHRKLTDETEKHWVFEKHNLPQNHLAIIAWFGDPNMDYDINGSFIQLTYEQLINKLTILSAVNSDVWDQFLSKPKVPPSARQAIQSQ